MRTELGVCERSCLDVHREMLFRPEGDSVSASTESTYVLGAPRDYTWCWQDPCLVPPLPNVLPLLPALFLPPFTLWRWCKHNRMSEEWPVHFVVDDRIAYLLYMTWRLWHARKQHFSLCPERKKGKRFVQAAVCTCCWSHFAAWMSACTHWILCILETEPVAAVTYCQPCWTTKSLLYWRK